MLIMMMTVKIVIISTLYVFCPFNPYDMLRNVICHGEITNNYFGGIKEVGVIRERPGNRRPKNRQQNSPSPETRNFM